MRKETLASLMSHHGYLVLAVEVSGARGKDDFVGVDDSRGAREPEYDIRACRGVTKPVRQGVNINLYRERYTRRSSLLESSHAAGAVALVVERHCRDRLGAE
jgi:hypothetical protein